MPFTFLAHQAPVLPIKSRRPDRWDGLALVVGSMAPDLAYVTSGTSHYFDGHRVQNQLALLVGSIVLTLVVRHLVLPVAPLAVPDGASPLRDALLDASRSRPRIWVIAYSALVGAITHIALDAFTHRDGYVVENVAAFRTAWFRVGGHGVSPYAVLQYGGSIVLGFWCVILLDRWWSRARSAPDAPRPTLRPSGRVLLWVATSLGVVAASIVAPSRYGIHDFGGRPYFVSSSVTIMTWCWIAFAGLLAGSVLARPLVVVGEPDHQPRSIHS